MSGQPDPRPPRRIKDRALMKLKHNQGGVCALADHTCASTLNLHHIWARSQGGDDVDANLVWLCGSGTTGHHGRVEDHDAETLLALRVVLLRDRPDTLQYLSDKLGPPHAVADWLERHL